MKLSKKLKTILTILFIFLILIFVINLFSNNSNLPVCYSCFWNNQPTEVKDLFNEVLLDYNAQNHYIESERLLILGRLNNNKDKICKSLDYKILFENEINDDLSLLVLYEEIYFLTKECSYEKQEEYLIKIIELSKKLEKEWKVEIYTQIKENNINKNIIETNIEKNTKIIENPTKIILGASKIIIDENSFIGSQVDRYNRDWLSLYFYYFPTDVPTPDYNLTFFDLDYHEGFLIRKITNHTNVKIIPLPNSNVIKTNKLINPWYATDEYGNLRFNIFTDKIQYSTTTCDFDACVFKDTHGISALVPEAIYNDVSLVIGCGDSVDKMKAAYYLSQKEIDIYMPTDRFIDNLIGYVGEGVILGSAPISFHDKNVIIGNRPIEININESIIVQDTLHKYYPLQYYDSSARYFKNLEKVYDIKLNIKYINISKTKQAEKIINKAREMQSNVVALKVQFEEEYEVVKEWLLEDKNNKVILFHSVLYEPGYKLFKEFPEQTSFGDPKPIFK